MLNDRGVRGVGRHESEAYDEYEQHMKADEAADNSPADVEFDQLELEDQPYEANVDDGDQDRRGHDAGPRKRFTAHCRRASANGGESR